MIRDADDILADALRLDAKTRSELAAEILASLDGPADPDAKEAWEAEIARRVEALESGADPTESWEATKARIEKEMPGR